MSLLIDMLAGLSVPRPKDLQLDILDGEVTALWEHPEGAPPNFHYNVQMAKYVPYHGSAFFSKNQLRTLPVNGEK